MKLRNSVTIKFSRQTAWELLTMMPTHSFASWCSRCQTKEGCLDWDEFGTQTRCCTRQQPYFHPEVESPQLLMRRCRPFVLTSIPNLGVNTEHEPWPSVIASFYSTILVFYNPHCCTVWGGSSKSCWKSHGMDRHLLVFAIACFLCGPVVWCLQEVFTRGKLPNTMSFLLQEFCTTSNLTCKYSCSRGPKLGLCGWRRLRPFMFLEIWDSDWYRLGFTNVFLLSNIGLIAVSPSIWCFVLESQIVWCRKIHKPWCGALIRIEVGFSC